MARHFEVHDVIAIPVTIDDDGTAIYGKPYQVSENPFMFGDECVWDMDREEWGYISIDDEHYDQLIEAFSRFRVTRRIPSSEKE